MVQPKVLSLPQVPENFGGTPGIYSNLRLKHTLTASRYLVSLSCFLCFVVAVMLDMPDPEQPFYPILIHQGYKYNVSV